MRNTARKNLTHTLGLWHASNLRARLDAATDAERAEGLAWYSNAHALALELSRAHGLSLRQTCGIIAALSPQVSWTVNQRNARLLCAGSAVDGLGLSVSRASAIRNSDACPLTILGGKKVRAFYWNILEPHAVGPVTIDRHALAILHGTDTPYYLGKYPKLVERKYAYTIAAAIYRSVAREYGLTPQDAQAIAWVSHRNAEYVEPF